MPATHWAIDACQIDVDHVLGAWSNVGDLYTTDLSLALDLSTQLQLAVTVNNLFDRKPPLTPDYARSASSLAQYKYAFDNSGPLCNVGGTYYASLTWHF